MTFTAWNMFSIVFNKFSNSTVIKGHFMPPKCLKLAIFVNKNVAILEYIFHGNHPIEELYRRYIHANMQAFFGHF